MNSLLALLSGRLNMENTSTLKKKKKYADIQEKDEGQERWIFIDIECQVDKKIDFQWNTFFQAF